MQRDPQSDSAQRAVAVVGLAAILPDAPNVGAFWENVLQGRNHITEVPLDRWDPRDYWDPDPAIPDKTYCKIGAFVRGFTFESPRFRIPPRVAAAMDIVQQWMLCCARDALADAGHPDGKIDPQRIGVILGNALGGELHERTTMRVLLPEVIHSLEQLPEFQTLPAEVRASIARGLLARTRERMPPITEDSMPGELGNVIAGRVTNALDLAGLNFTVDAACASSLGALDAAIAALIDHRIDAVVTGGVDRTMGPATFVKFAKIGALSPDGSRPFDAHANGFVMGEGCVAMVLRRLADAERDHQRIYAVIRSVGGSSDGKGKGITAPNPKGQVLAIHRAYEIAGKSPKCVGLIEAHGTSTGVGDAAEAQSLTQAFADCGLPLRSIALGSVKSQIGHLKSAAGAVGMLKAVLALHHKVLPPTINVREPNPTIPFDRLPFFLNTKAQPWERPADGVRCAGVSSFGFGGTNFHVVLEEHVPGLLTERRVHPSGEVSSSPTGRGVVCLGAQDAGSLRARLNEVMSSARQGRLPAERLAKNEELGAPQRVCFDFKDQSELLDRAEKASSALGSDDPKTWRALKARGIFRSSGPAPKVAFLFPGQGSQYLGMLRAMFDSVPEVRETMLEAERVLADKLSKPLTQYIFAAESEAADAALRDTSICQPAVLAVDTGLCRLLGRLGIEPDMVIGHSLGEYGALVASGALPFADALLAVSARAREMASVSIADNGRMASVFASEADVRKVLSEIDGYVVTANLNSRSQTVIGGATRGVEQALAKFASMGIKAVPIPVSHAFHTEIVAPASKPLRSVLARLGFQAPRLPIISNVTGEPYPTSGDVREQMLDLLARQVSSPVQFVKGLETLYRLGARVFVEVGPRRILASFVEDVLGDRGDVVALCTNHPKKGELESFGEALCGLWASGLGRKQPSPSAIPNLQEPSSVPDTSPVPQQSSKGSIVITGAGLGLPGREQHVFAEDNVERILRGDTLIEPIPLPQQERMAQKQIVRLNKGSDGSANLETITRTEQVLHLAGQRGKFDLVEEFGIAPDRADAFEITTKLAIGAALLALRDAGVPLVRRYRKTSKGTFLPDRWMLPESLADETGVVFASAFPGHGALIHELNSFHENRARQERLAELKAVRAASSNGATSMLDERIAALEAEIARNPYHFDRKFLFHVLSMGHSQLAELIGARGPNTQINSACASTALAVGVASDWIRSGRCRRVLVVTADDVSNDEALEWFGSGFLASGAATTETDITRAALPFDRRRHGLIVGMGASSLFLESEDAVRERGMRGIAEVLGVEICNSAFHGTRLDVEHISQVMERLVSRVEAERGLRREEIAQNTVFVSHETYTPARGGSAAAEIHSLRQVFRDQASKLVVANTKGMTGHPMGAGIEEAVAVKILERGIVPPVPNLREPDPELGDLTLSKGGAYPVRFALRLGAGFGSQVAMSFLQKIDGPRTVDAAAYARWLEEQSGRPGASCEVEKKTLRIRDDGPPAKTPAISRWVLGTGPTLQAISTTAGEAARIAQRVEEPMRAPAAPAPAQVTEAPKAAPAASQPAGAGAVGERLLELVSKKTGYPRDMLALELDLEADLGIDTVKQAEIFSEIRAAFDLPRMENFKLRDYPTLADLIKLVHKMKPDLAAAQPVPSLSREPVPTSVPVAAVSSAAPSAAPAAQSSSSAVSDRLLELVSQKTGYPRDMLALDLDLEADLGIDTVKQAEIFSELRAAFNLPRRDDMKLRDYPTLGHLIRFISEARPDLAAAMPAVPSAAAAPAAAPVPAQAPATAVTAAAITTGAAAASGAPSSSADPVAQRLLALVAEKTGYPSDMLALDLDLEADLGIDTVKQAEIFSELRTTFNLPRREDFKLRDYPTLNHLIGLVKQMKAAEAPAAAAPAPGAASQPVQAAAPLMRRSPMPVIRPSLELCKETGAQLEAGARVIVVADAGGVSEALAAALRERKVKVLQLKPSSKQTVEEQVAAWLASGPIAGVFHLAALDPEADLPSASPEEVNAALELRVRRLYRLCRALLPGLGQRGAFLVAGTRMGGAHGYGKEPATAPMGGAVSGFVKAFGRESPEAVVKVVDFGLKASPETIAASLIGETLRDPGAVETGYLGATRCAIGLGETPRPAEKQVIALGSETVFLVTGAAGGITSAIARDLAQASKGIFWLLDLSPLPKADNPDLKRLASDRDGLRREIFERMKSGGKRVTPAQVEKVLSELDRDAAVLNAIRALEECGARVQYRSLDVRDSAAMAAVVSEIRAAHGRIDVVVHAAGLERSKLLAEKPPEEFDRIFDVKVLGLCNLLRAAEGMPIGAVVSFSSVAGRFGNGGQTDYSAANDFLCKVGLAMPRWRRDTRALAIDWTAWGSIGMATRGSIPEMMRRAGIDMLEPHEGVPVVREEIMAGSRGEIVAAKGLGMLVAPRDPQGGLDLPAVAKRLAPDRLPMVGKILSMDPNEGLRIDCELDPNAEPFLRDHALEGTSVLPGVMGLEGFAEVASLLLPEHHVVRIEEARFDAPFKYYRQQPRSGQFKAILHPEGADEVRAELTLTSLRTPPGAQQAIETRHFSGVVRLSRVKPKPTTDSAIKLELPKARSISIEDLYHVFFHGPAYRVVGELKLTEHGIRGKLNDKLPHALARADGVTVLAPRVIELCLQAAGALEIGYTGQLGLPSAIDRLEIHGALSESAALSVDVRANPSGTGYDARVFDNRGRVLMEIIGYRTAQLPVDSSEHVLKLRAALGGAKAKPSQAAVTAGGPA